MIQAFGGVEEAGLADSRGGQAARWNPRWDLLAGSDGAPGVRGCGPDRTAGERPTADWPRANALAAGERSRGVGEVRVYEISPATIGP